MPLKPSFKEALHFWIKLGFISFGGPAGQIAIMHTFLVEHKKWISESKFLHALNYCMVLPGPEAQQLATYMGWLLHGVRGGIAAGVLFILPSLLILFGLSGLYVLYGDNPWVYALFSGLKPAVIAIVLLALVKIGKKSLLSPFHYFIAISAFILIFFFNISFPLIILGAILIAAGLRKYFPALFQKGNKSIKENTLIEEEYCINKNTVIPGIGYKPSVFWKKVIFFALLWAAPLLFFLIFSSDFAFWKQVSFFFTQAAFVTFGGAYAVLPYVAQVSVEKFHWLSNMQMIDGLALGETTPGPLIMVLVFVGFMAGYNHFGASVAMGGIGLLTTAFYTFLPSFFFILAGAPLIERTQENKAIKEILGLITAAVVGVILSLTIYLGKAVLFPSLVNLDAIDYFSLCWIIISFVALKRFAVNMVTWIGVSAVFGLVIYAFERMY